MKTHELILPAGAQAMGDLAMSLTMEARALAAKHGLTIDGGGKGAHASLPKGRLNYLLLGGYLTPRGGIRAEARQTTPYFDRVKAFTRELFKDLQLIQVMGIGEDLHNDYDVEIRLDKKARAISLAYDVGMVPVADTTADEVVSNLVMAGSSKSGREEDRLIYPILTWKITRRKLLR